MNATIKRKTPGPKASDRRYTPGWLIELVVEALGPIILDPCTEPHNPVGAKHFFALPENGLNRAWGTYGGLIWCNCPFSNLLGWAERAVEEAREYGCEIVFLSPVDSTTRWYSLLTEHAQLAAPLKRRCAFGFPEDHPAPPESAAKAACKLWYFGTRTKDFARVFRQHAHLYIPGMFP